MRSYNLREAYIFILINVCLIFCYSLKAQNQYNIWYFGYDTNFAKPTAGLDFNGGTPVALLDSKMSFTEGCASYCNSAGQLLFYTNGDSVWDRTHTAMPNGKVGLPGEFTQSSMQNSVIVPVYGDANTYYLFLNAGIPTSGSTGIMYYTTIDMTLNGGLGDVAAPLTTLVTGTAERITGIKHCNGKDHWVITHKYGTNTFVSIRATKCGVMDTVISSIGPAETGSLWTHLKASPKGNKLSTVIYDVNLGPITCIYDFDNATGKITGYTPIDTADIIDVSIANMFSPDGNLFYLSSGPSFPLQIYQFDLTATNIPATQTYIGSNSVSADSIETAYDFQIGRDGKLYVGVSDDFMALHTLDVINSPNTLGVGCGYTNGGVSLGDRSCWLSLPNHITDYLNPLPIKQMNADFTNTEACIGSGISFNDVSANCSVIKWRKWNFGDPLCENNPCNSSSATTPSHIYNSAGTYSVSLIISDGCNTDTVIKTLTICSSDYGIPTAFSPNGDGENDQFRIQGNILFKDFQLEIFDRWGKRLFESADANVNWDGTYKGSEVDSGVFIYVLRATLSNDETVLHKGNITLVR